MKGKIKTLFRRASKSKHISKKGLILSVVALVEIIAIMLVSTTAWVENVSSIVMRTNGKSGTIETPISQRANVNKSSNNIIDLTHYFRPSGNYHLTAASSADGNVFYFPEGNGGDTTNFRKGSINDKNVNYISFTFKITSAVNLAFDEVPTVNIGGKKVEDNLVRFSIGYNNSFNIYGNTDQTENVVGSEDGSKEATEVHSFSKYTKGFNRVISTTGDSTLVTISMWIQDPTFANESRYSGKTVTVNNFKLVAVEKLEAIAVSNGTVGSTGGTVAINDGEFGPKATAYVAYGQRIKLKASPNVTNGYAFLGWSTTLTGLPLKNSNIKNAAGDYEYEYTVNSDTTLYAKFTDKHILYLKPKYLHNDKVDSVAYAAYIWGTEDGALKKTWYHMTYDSSKSAYKCEYKGNANSVIFAYMDPSSAKVDLNSLTGNDAWDKYRWLQTYDLRFPQELGEYTYIVTSRKAPYNTYGKVYGYWEHDYATVNVSARTGQSSYGTVNAYLSGAYSDSGASTRYSDTSLKVDGTQYKDDGNTNDKYEAKVMLTAKAKDGYEFKGWYNSASGGTVESTNAEYEVTAPANGTKVTYYAQFDKKQVSWYLKGDFNQWGTNNPLTNTSGSNCSTSIALKAGSYVFKIHNLVAGDNGWYTDGTTITDDGSSPTTSKVVCSNKTLITSGNNMTFKVTYDANYTFTFNTSTKSLTITRTSLQTVRIWFDISSLTGISDQNPRIQMVTDQGTVPSMTKSGNAYYADVPSNYATGIWFNRINANNSNETWNSWNAGSRNGHTRYKPTSWGDPSGSGGSGSWSD